MWGREVHLGVGPETEGRKTQIWEQLGDLFKGGAWGQGQQLYNI